MMKRVLLVAAAMFFVALTFSLAEGRREDVITYCCGSTTVTPGTPITVDFHTNEGDKRPIHLRVYRISLDDAIALERRGERGESGHVTGTLLWEGNARGRTSGWVREVAVGPFPIGLYVVQGSVGTATDAVLANVTTLGLVSIGAPGGAAVWAVDLRTFKRHEGPTTVRIAGESTSRELNCDSDGLALVRAAVPSDAVYVARTSDGSVDVERFWNTGDFEDTSSVYVQTDRPVYRPGQTVYFHAILRSGYEDAYRIPSGRHRVEIDDENGTPVFKKALTLSPFGTLSGQTVLPADDLGNYSLKIDDAYQKSFYVEAYKKPEYLMQAQPRAATVVGGDDAVVSVRTAYVFGRPAAGMHVHYDAYPQWYYWREFSPYGSYAPAVDRGELARASGDATTDKNGDVSIRLSTKRTKSPYDLTFQIAARDASGRSIQSSASVVVYPAAVQLTLTPRDWFAQAGSDVSFDVASTDVAGKPAPNARVALTFVRSVWNSAEGRSIDDGSQTQSVITDNAGHASVRWRVGAEGSYRLTGRTVDSRGNVETARQYLWVIGNDDRWLPPLEQPVLIPQHETIGENERPRVLVRMPAPGRDIVLTVSTDRLISARVVHVTGYAASVGFDAPKDATQFSVQAILPTEQGLSTADVTIHRKPPAKQLVITLEPNRKAYEPGEPASFDARVTDVHGKPERTELSLDVVDDAIYAVQSDDAGDPVEQFFGKSVYVSSSAGWYRPNYVPAPMGSEQGVPAGSQMRTVAHVSARASGQMLRPGTTSDVYSVTAKVRKNFADTAFWSPSVVTDKRGRARITFTWPDNLTTWRTSALGVSTDSSVGSARTETLVTKDFLVRLEMPRFLRTGDRSTIVGIAQGQHNAPDVRLTLEPDPGDPLSQALQLDSNDSASAAWQLDAGNVLGMRTLTLSGTDGLRNDAMQLPLPIESAGAAEHVRDAGELPGQDAVGVLLAPGYDAGDLRITLTPSLAAQLLQNVRMLDVYPYDCTEQTMSAALPAIFVDRLFQRSGLEMPSDVPPSQVVKHAIQRLSELQHDDGSFGWWDTDAAHPYMTAYAVYGLAEFKKAGYAGVDAMLSRGVESLSQQLPAANTDTLRFWGGAQRGSEWNTRAFMLFALADAAPARVDRSMLAQTWEHSGELNAYALAVLGLAYHELGDDATAKRVLAILNVRAVTNGPYTYWTGDTWHYAWEDDPIETTAYALRLNAALAPDSAIVARTVAFLRSEQHGSWWYTTKDTAAAVYAISEAEHPSTDEFHPDETVRVELGSRVIKSVHVTSAVLGRSDAEIDLPASLLQNASTVRIERTGRGSLYWSSDFVRYAPWSVHQVRDSGKSLFAKLFAQQPPLSIERRYTVDHSGAWRVGDVVHVGITVTARDDVQYVAIEDPFPAGVEYTPPQGEAGSSNWSGVQFFDDRAVFFADTIYRAWPLHLDYDLRVTAGGAYAAPPPTAYAMYGPPVSATGSGQHVVVQEK